MLSQFQFLVAFFDPAALPERYPILRYAFELVNDPTQNKALAYAKDFIEVLNGGSGPYVETLSAIFMLCVGIEMFRSLTKLPKEKLLDVALPFFGATIAAWVALCNYETLVTGILSVGQFFYDIAGIHTSHIDQVDNVELTLADQFINWVSWFSSSIFTGAFLVEIIATFVMLIGLFRVSMEYVIGLYIGTMALVPALALYPIREVRPATHSLLRYLFTVSLYPFWWIILLAAQNWVFHGFQLAAGSSGGPIITALGRLSIGFLLYKIPTLADRVVSSSFNLSGVAGSSAGEAAGIATFASSAAIVGAITGALGGLPVAAKNLIGGLGKIGSGLGLSSSGGGSAGGSGGDGSSGGPGAPDLSGGSGDDDGGASSEGSESNSAEQNPPPILGGSKKGNLLKGIAQTAVGGIQAVGAPFEGAVKGSVRPFARFFGGDLRNLPSLNSLGGSFEDGDSGNESGESDSGSGDGNDSGGSNNPGGSRQGGSGSAGNSRNPGRTSQGGNDSGRRDSGSRARNQNSAGSRPPGTRNRGVGESASKPGVQGEIGETNQPSNQESTQEQPGVNGATENTTVPPVANPGETISGESAAELDQLFSEAQQNSPVPQSIGGVGNPAGQPSSSQPTNGTSNSAGTIGGANTAQVNGVSSSRQPLSQPGSSGNPSTSQGSNTAISANPPTAVSAQGLPSESTTSPSGPVPSLAPFPTGSEIGGEPLNPAVALGGSSAEPTSSIQPSGGAGNPPILSSLPSNDVPSPNSAAQISAIPSLPNFEAASSAIPRLPAFEGATSQSSTFPTSSPEISNQIAGTKSSPTGSVFPPPLVVRSPVDAYLKRKQQIPSVGPPPVPPPISNA